MHGASASSSSSAMQQQGGMPRHHPMWRGGAGGGRGGGSSSGGGAIGITTSGITTVGSGALAPCNSTAPVGSESILVKVRSSTTAGDGIRSNGNLQTAASSGLFTPPGSERDPFEDLTVHSGQENKGVMHYNHQQQQHHQHPDGSSSGRMMYNSALQSMQEEAGPSGAAVASSSTAMSLEAGPPPSSTTATVSATATTTAVSGWSPVSTSTDNTQQRLGEVDQRTKKGQSLYFSHSGRGGGSGGGAKLP